MRNAARQCFLLNMVQQCGGDALMASICLDRQVMNIDALPGKYQGRFRTLLHLKLDLAFRGIEGIGYSHVIF